MTERERMLSGMLYQSEHETLRQARLRASELTFQFNQTAPHEAARREALLRELLGTCGGPIWVEPTFRCDYGSYIHIAGPFYANYDCVILDVCEVRIGRNVLFGPRVCLYTAGHPIDAEVRASGLEFGRPITIGDDVWVGGSTVVNPGVTIGSRVVIGAGSVVTRDLPDDVIAVGNPCRVLRTITEEDRAHWQSLARSYWEEARQPEIGAKS